MSQPRNCVLCALALVALSGAASAQDVQGGIAAWQQGDYARAVEQWRPLAEAGNADAQFNLGQAYRLGRGVAQNLNLAEQWFERAARQRHEQAGTSLGLLLFQNGRAREAMPWLQAAAIRGDPRAQYVFGTALFNGDIVRRDLPRAYALMSAAAAQGFPQAQTQLAEMERQLSPEDRERGRQIAVQMAAPAPAQPAPAEVAAAQPRRVPPAAETTRPRPQPGVSYAPPSEDGRTTTAHPPATRPQPAPRPVRTERPRPVTSAPIRVVEQAAPPRPVQGRVWRVQLGAFSTQANAQRQWQAIRRRVAALGPLQPAYMSAGPLTRLRAGPLADRAAAERICAAVRSGGGDCIPVAP